VSKDFPWAGRTLMLGPAGSVAHPLNTDSIRNGVSFRINPMVFLPPLCCPILYQAGPIMAKPLLFYGLNRISRTR
jgi:hypothetical protein